MTIRSRPTTKEYRDNFDATFRRVPQPREPDFNSYFCPKCGLEVGMMGHGSQGCPAEKKP